MYWNKCLNTTHLKSTLRNEILNNQANKFWFTSSFSKINSQRNILIVSKVQQTYIRHQWMVSLVYQSKMLRKMGQLLLKNHDLLLYIGIQFYKSVQSKYFAKCKFAEWNHSLSTYKNITNRIMTQTSQFCFKHALLWISVLHKKKQNIYNLSGTDTDYPPLKASISDKSLPRLVTSDPAQFTCSPINIIYPIGRGRSQTQWDTILVCRWVSTWVAPG